MLFEGVSCGPNELLANVETGQPEDGPGLALAAAAALSLARVVVGEILDPELQWTTNEHATPDVFLESIRVESLGTRFEEQFAKFLSRLNRA